MGQTDHLPASFSSEEDLEEFLSRPSPSLVHDLEAVPGDIAIIGVGGKMGPNVARMAKRAAPNRTVYGVSRFSDKKLRADLEALDISTVEVDLLDRNALTALPQAPNVVFMAGRKFGSQGGEDLTWAMNTYVPGMVADHYAASRIVAFSTICVYPFVPIEFGGAREGDPLGPPGEYAMSCVGRERMFRHFSGINGTPGALVRLSYAIDMRYGVLHDLAAKILRNEAIDLEMGHVNIIWQGDACSQALRLLRHCSVPSAPFNISGPETASIRSLASSLAERLAKPVRFTGKESPTAWLSDTGKAESLFGYPEVPVSKMLDWTADWARRGLRSYQKTTHYEVRTGTY